MSEEGVGFLPPAYRVCGFFTTSQGGPDHFSGGTGWQIYQFCLKKLINRK
jgi:hypothetical protein